MFGCILFYNRSSMWISRTRLHHPSTKRVKTTEYLTISIKHPSLPRVFQSYLWVWRCLEPPKALDPHQAFGRLGKEFGGTLMVAPGAFATRRCSLLPRCPRKHGPWAMQKKPWLFWVYFGDYTTQYPVIRGFCNKTIIRIPMKRAGFNGKWEGRFPWLKSFFFWGGPPSWCKWIYVLLHPLATGK